VSVAVPAPRAASGGLALVVAAALCWHLLSVLSPAWVRAVEPHKGRDFASYYWAAQVARDGGDPYDRPALVKRAREEGARGAHPYFYPPPFLAGVSWIAAFDLTTAFRVWFWLDEVCALLSALVLWRWWRPLSEWTPAVVAVLLALMTAVPNNHAMGQANFIVLALLVAGLYAEDRAAPGDRASRVVGGVLVGMACMAKMAPALFVVWWLVRRRWVAAASACGAAVVLSVLSLPTVSFGDQVRFYTEILPKFASGDYNGLTIPITLFGNHSIPNLLNHFWPGTANTLSSTAAWLSRVASLALVVGMSVLYGLRPARGWTSWNTAGQAASIGVAMLLIPVYTYEHHLIWALPAAVVVVLAALTGRLPAVLTVTAAVSIVFLLYDLQDLKQLAMARTAPTAQLFVQELKFLALLGLLGCSTWVGRMPEPSD
jgi:alpha-1,2-mannosyltransferase